MFDQNNIEIYSDRDKIREQMIEYMQEYLELDDIDLSKTSYLSYLINILSMLTANLMYFNSSVAREFFLTKAIQKESVLNLASMLGYPTQFASPAQVSILVGIPTSFDSDTTVVIPKNFKYYAGDIVFTQDNKVEIELINPESPSTLTQRVQQFEDIGDDEDAIVKNIPFQYNDDKSVIYFNVTARQEEIESQEFQIPRLEPFEFHNLNMEFEGNLSGIVVVTLQSSIESTPEEWLPYDSLFQIPSGTRGFVYRQTGSGGKIFFGNGVIGRQPGSGQRCNIELSKTRGAEGNVIAGSIIKSDTIYVTSLVDGSEVSRPVKMNVINPAPALGGEDAPSIDEIRAAAMANVSSSKRLVTAEDYRNIKYIVEDLPIEHAIEVLKRSDIKRNEITLFTDLIYDNRVVPTKNASFAFDSTGTLRIQAGTMREIQELDEYGNLIDVEYRTMFDMEIDPIVQECSYYYILGESNLAVTLRSTATQDTKVLPSYVYMKTIRDLDNPDNDLLQIDLYYQIVDPDPEYDFSHLEATFIRDWDLVEAPMTHYYDSSVTTENHFRTTVLLSDIPSGSQIFNFSVQYQDPLEPSPEEFFTASTETIVKRDLSEYMYSQVKSALDPPGYENIVYDVPVIQRDYYDNQIDQDDFNLAVIQKIISFNVIQYRMLTDFLNLKFSNTTGNLENMYFNKRKFTVDGKDPVGVPPSPANGERYLITSVNNSWGETPIKVMEYRTTTGAWTAYSLAINDMVYDDSTDTMWLFNGEDMVNPIIQIPFKIRMAVWKDDASSISTSALSSRISNSLVDTFYTRFGYDKPIYRSEIVRHVQAIDGVEHCQLIEPRHDIFFDYDIYEDFTQEQLLEYSPELVYFDTSTIIIEPK